MRKSILACTVSVLMSPVASWALGMGDIQVSSSLNQILNAEIELHSVKKKDLDSLHIGLAPKSAYRRADIERADYLSKFRFKVIQRGGKHYVSITTRKPFKEPFANFLVEAKWSSGRLLREYTMLVDPPEFVKKHAKPVSTAATSRSAQVKRAPVKKALAKTVSKAPVMDVAPADDELYPEGSIDEQGQELVYGPTQRNDTLYGIAKSMAPENVSINQMMMALLRDNPEAFVNNNINNLKSGYVLRIKDTASLRQVDSITARNQVREQYQNWKKTRAQEVSGTSLVDRSDRSTDDKMARDGELKLLASGKTDTASTSGSISQEASQLKDKLALAGEELESKEIENQELRERIKELEAILETKSSLVQLKDESLAALQKQKEISQQEQAATETAADAMPEPDAAEMAPAVEAEMAPADTEMAPATDTEMAPATETEMAPADTEMAPAVDTTAMAEATVSDDAEATPAEAMPGVEKAAEQAMEETVAETKVEEPTPEEVKPAVAETKVEEQPVKKPEPKPVKKPEPVAEESIVDMLLGDNLPYTAGGGALLVLILAWLGLRGRGKKDNDFEESILDSKLAVDETESDFEIADSELEEPDSGTEVVAADTETSFLSDFSSDDMESLQPDDTEADPISEADVFMVYGRYTQAEELLKNAITQEPDRLDYQMKLLEVYHGDNQKDAFAVQADVVRDALKKNSDDFELTSEWTKAKSWAEKLGVDIDMPDSFDEGIMSSESSVETEATEKSEESDVELSLDDLSDELSLESDEINFNEEEILADTDETVFESGDDESVLEQDDSELELTLDELDTDSEAETEADIDLQESDILDLEESTLDLGSAEEAVEQSKDLSEDTLDFDTSLDLEEVDNEAELESDAMLDLEDSLELDEGASLELEPETSESDLELEESMELEDSLVLDEGTDTLELEDSLELEETEQLEDSLDLGDDLQLEEDTETLANADELDVLGDELEEDFAELDAVGTKLDLAKAYIDMGDMESASSILNEVIDEGDEEQKSQAQELLNQTNA